MLGQKQNVAFFLDHPVYVKSYFVFWTILPKFDLPTRRRVFPPFCFVLEGAVVSGGISMANNPI